MVDGLHRAALQATSDGDAPASTSKTAARLGDRPLPLDATTHGALHSLEQGVEQLIEEILDSGAGQSLESLKSHNSYTFEHSVDVAVTATLLGHLAGLQRRELTMLALGGLLHDLGKTFIDLAILDKAGPLNLEERAEIGRHPRMGFELVKRMPVRSILPAHIALQHHERQDGTGYPNGLQGANRVERRTAERMDPRHMLLFAEICAVADVHSALASDRPYRPALPPERLHEVLRGMAGAHLNADLVRLLQSSVPVFTVGRWVELVGGPYNGWRGVVTAVGASGLDPPAVRLHLSASGEGARSPIEVDVAELPGILLRSAPPGHPSGLVTPATRPSEVPD